ncbi:helix-turn-helix transcriptional regulator [Micromonospora sp. WMMD998]|uniref:helix-turn-helix domain-containing protein n=1 Tax=Micromonospora sp. WMMD998 TaxID=3016092 RepID=UPI00249C8941|nr:helix-turn-helix transcriptional regulator [Micromonospora sp. WMMD998]WFE41700.1 helix-turn-helix transcriptional regulator [Micromonospora sp. WMMD998]
MTGSPTVRRRRLAAALRRLREQTGMTADQAAKEVGISKSALSRIENAQVSVMPPVARGLLDLYGVEGDEIDALVQVARDARKRGWWQAYDDVLPDWFEVYVGLEAEASEIRAFQPQLIPGLLQTADYARAVVRAEHPDSPDNEIERRVELRMRRQSNESPPNLWVVLDEAVLRRPVGGAATFKAQLHRLAEEADRPGNTVQILTFAAGEYGSMGSAFSLLAFPEPADPGVVYVETRAGSLYLEGQQVREYTRVFEHLVATAAGARRSRDLIREAINQL